MATTAGLLIKVCGLREPENIRKVVDLKPHFGGLIFHSKSKRFVTSDAKEDIMESFGNEIIKTGVFVDHSLPEIIDIAHQFQLKAIQLHGDFSPQICSELKGLGFQVIKVFSVGVDFDFSVLDDYSDGVDFFLFDTAGPKPGGNGFAFNWGILNAYKGNKPFFLSGGIGPDDVAKIAEFKHPKFAGIDLNSRFETEPAIKNVELLQKFLREINF